MELSVKAHKDRLRLFERQPDPAGGRTEEHDVLILTLDQAYRLIGALNRELPIAIAYELKNRQAALTIAEDELIKAEVKVQSIKDHIKKLKG
jgi:hypothetical protein